MRKILLSAIVGAVCGASVFAGGIVTNANQSASYVRMYARDASTDIDAVYYNPAGLAKLADGFYLSFNNQTITQEKTITSEFPLLNNSDYVGDVVAPLFPGVYAVFKKGKIALSLGVNPSGGGGSAKYDAGLPSFEKTISTLPAQLADYGVTGYSADLSFEGTSVYWGVQLGATYEVSDMLSVFVGGRYINAKTTYDGYMKSINVIQGGTAIPASTFFDNLAAQATAAVAQLTPASESLQLLVGGGAGTLTFAQAEGASVIDATQRAQLEVGLLGLGYDQAAIDAMDIATAEAIYSGAVTEYTGAAAQATATSALVSDQKAVTDQTATGFTPIIGINLSPNDKLNIGLKYEFKTELEFTNETSEELLTGFDENTGAPIYYFPDGQKSRYDIPAFFTGGISYKLTDDFMVSSGVHYYFDKGADWDGKEDEVEDNYWEWAIGFEYGVSEKIALSAGFLHANTGVGAGYQTDLSYSLTSNTVGFGGKLSVSPILDINLGMSYTMYQEGEVTLSGADYGLADYSEFYDKDALIFSIGVDVKFSKVAAE